MGAAKSETMEQARAQPSEPRNPATGSIPQARAGSNPTSPATGPVASFPGKLPKVLSEPNVTLTARPPSRCRFDARSLVPEIKLRIHEQREAELARDERAPFHSITSSARASSIGGMVSSSAWAVVRLMTRSNLVGCSTGRSTGFAPRNILSTKSAARRKKAGKLGP